MAIIRNNRSKFIPRELEINGIKSLFNECVASESTTHHHQILLRHSDTQPSIVFDSDILIKKLPTIKYVLGQLDAVHKKQSTINASELGIRYDGKKLFDDSDKATPIQLLALGIASLTTSRLNDSNSLNILSTVKTLSPFDPEYKTWWAEHEKEWTPEDPSKQLVKRPGGTEPGDN